MEIKGKVATAIAYANVIEDAAIEQIRRMCDYAFTEGSKSYVWAADSRNRIEKREVSLGQYDGDSSDYYLTHMTVNPTVIDDLAGFVLSV